MNIRRQSETFQSEEDPLSKNVQGIGKIYLEVLLLKKVLQTQPSVKSVNITYYHLYYTVMKNRDKNEVVNDEYESDFNNFKDLITPNHYIGRKNNKEILG